MIRHKFIRSTSCDPFGKWWNELGQGVILGCIFFLVWLRSHFCHTIPSSLVKPPGHPVQASADWFFGSNAQAAPHWWGQQWKTSGKYHHFLGWNSLLLRMPMLYAQKHSSHLHPFRAMPCIRCIWHDRYYQEISKGWRPEKKKVPLWGLKGWQPWGCNGRPPLKTKNDNLTFLKFSMDPTNFVLKMMFIYFPAKNDHVGVGVPWWISCIHKI